MMAEDIADPPGAGNGPKRRFALGWICLIPIAINVAVELVYYLPLGLYRANETGAGKGFVYGYLAYGFLVSLAIPLGIALLAWGLTGRSRTVATWVFCILLLLTTGWQYLQVYRIEQANARRVMTTHFAQFAKNRAELDAAQARFDQAGGNAAALKEPGVLDQRIRSIDDIIAKTNAQIEAGDKTSEQLLAKLNAIGMSRAAAEREVRAASADFKWDSLRRGYVNTLEFYRAVRDMLAFFKAHPDDWRGEGNIGSVTWKTLEEAQEFVKLRNAVNAAIEKAQPAATMPAPAL